MNIKLVRGLSKLEIPSGLTTVFVPNVFMLKDMVTFYEFVIKIYLFDTIVDSVRIEFIDCSGYNLSLCFYKGISHLWAYRQWEEIKARMPKHLAHYEPLIVQALLQICKIDVGKL